MADIIQAKYDRLEDISSRFQQQEQLMDLLQQNVARAMEQLQNGGWDGLGSQAFFNEMQTQVLPGVRRLASALNEANQVTKKISAVLQNADQDAASPFKKGDGSGGANGNSSADGKSNQNDMMVPKDWLKDVKDNMKGGQDAAGKAAKDAKEKQNGGGGGGDKGKQESGGSTGSDSGGGSQGGSSGGGNQGGGSPSTGSGFPVDFGSMVGADRAEAAIQRGALAFQSTPMGAPASSTGHSVALGSGRAGSPAVADGQSNFGLPLGIAALSPILALVGKVIKDKSEN